MAIRRDSLRKKVYNIIKEEEDDIALPAKIWDGIIIILILGTLIFSLLDTFEMPVWYHSFSHKFEVASVIAFTTEYLLHLWTAPEHFHDVSPSVAARKQFFSFMAVIDLVAILPFYLPYIIPIDLRVLHILRIIKLFRILKIKRYNNAIDTITKVFKNKSSQLASSVFILFILMIISSVLMYNIESAAQPEVFDNALAGLWWSVETFTTVGYGDIYPITVVGKILSAITALLGIGLVAVPTGIISAGFVEIGDTTRNDISKMDEIEKAYALAKKNIITQSEFDKVKRSLLK